MSGHRRRPDRLPAVLVAVVLVIAAAAAAVMVATWPHAGAVTAVADRAGLVDTNVSYVSGTVTSARATTCPGTTEDTRPDGTVPAVVTCLQIQVHLTSGSRAGDDVQVTAPGTVRLSQLTSGTPVVVEHYPATAGQAETWAWSDFRRTVPLGALVVAFVVVAGLVGGWRGLRAVLGLGVALVVLWMYLLPVLITGRHPTAATIAASTAVMVVVGYLTHGTSRRTTTALLGTVVGIGLVAALGALAAAATRIDPVADQDAYQLSQLLGDDGVARLHAVFLAGVVLAGLGVLNDVTITQAAAVHELHRADPGAAAGALFGGGMRIGREHLASTIYTVAFAYTGAALPVLLVLQLDQLPLGQTLVRGTFAQEIVRAGVGAIGLLLAIPVTTGIAAVVESRRPVPVHALAPVHSH